MSRRTVVASLLGAALTVGGLGALLAPAQAAACPAWTDLPGDATTGETGVAALGDENMDIVGASFGTIGDTVTATITSKKLNAGASDLGDEFRMAFTVNGKNFILYADRAYEDLADPVVGIYNLSDDADTSGGAVTYDVAKSTVTITIPYAKLVEAAGDVAGKDVTAVAAQTLNQFEGATFVYYDRAPGPVPMSLSTRCGGSGPAPSPAPTSPSPSPAPTGPSLPGFPKDGCAQIHDGPGDGKAQTPAGGVGDNDPDLDILGVAFETTPTHLKAYLKLAQLAAKPANGPGHQFDVAATIGTKVYEFYTSNYDSNGNTARDTLVTAGVLVPRTGGRVGGSVSADLKVSARYEIAASTVVLEIERAGLEKVQGEPITTGTQLTATRARSHIGVVTGTNLADTAQAAEAGARVYAIGDNRCFVTATRLANAGATRVQYGDAAAVAVKLTTATGTPVASRSVTLTLAGRSATVSTDAAGVARASIPTSVPAGSATLVATFAGDSAYERSAVSVPVTVTTETTRLALAVAKSGSARSVTATLTEDDPRPLAGQKVNWYVNGRKVATVTTDAAGRAVLRTAKPTQTVVAEFVAVAGKYAGSKATARV